MKRYPIFLLLAMLMLLCSCRESELKRMPDTLPDIRGNITSVAGTNPEDEQATITILVKAIEGIDVRVNEASIRVTGKTLIENSTGKVLSPAALRQGQEVEVWFGEQVMESMPVQAEAIAVRVTKPE